MSQSGYTPILTYASGTPGNTPLAANMTSSASGAELALNYADGRLFYKDSGGTVQVLATKGTAAIGGSNTQVQYNSSGSLAGSANLTFDGTSLTLGGNPTLSAGTANGVAYLNGSKVLTSGSALTFDGTTLKASLGSSGATAVSNGNTLVLENSAAVGMSLLTPDANASRIYFGTASNNRNAFIYSDYNSGAQTLIFGLGSGATAASEQMRLTSTGLGIGTSSPSQKLDVAGQITISSGNGYLWGNGAVQMYSNTSYLRFRTASTDRLEIDSSGNLGLGVTPSAWASGQAAMQFKFGGLSAWALGGVNGYLYSNAYYDGSVNKYVNNGFACSYAINNAVGAHVWYNAPSGTAGTNISFTQAMTLDASGQLAIGTSTANSNTMLTLNRAGFNQFYMQVSGTNKLSLYADTAVSAVDAQANPLAFYAGSAERARIDASGNFFIGTTNIGYSRKLGVTSSGDTAMIQTTGSATSTPCEFWNTATSGDNRFTFFYTEGTPTARGSIDYNRAGGLTRYNTTSDQRLKENIVDAPSAMSLINGIKIRSFDWKETGFHVDHGVIAQELQQVVPEAVSVGDDNEDESVKKPWGVDTSVLVPALVKALQEMKAIIDDQAARIAALEAK